MTLDPWTGSGLLSLGEEVESSCARGIWKLEGKTALSCASVSPGGWTGEQRSSLALTFSEPATVCVQGQHGVP